ncbi:hypothetical protein [Novipirellula caenicola]|uniref:hypothetical protein n=1 Tax=Novipirellula caenicola TaxID=1536901 RepID=UPI0031F0489B
MQIFAQQFSRNLLDQSLIATPMMPIIFFARRTKIILILPVLESGKDAIRTITHPQLVDANCTQGAIYGA